MESPASGRWRVHWFFNDRPSVYRAVPPYFRPARIPERHSAFPASGGFLVEPNPTLVSIEQDSSAPEQRSVVVSTYGVSVKHCFSTNVSSFAQAPLAAAGSST